MNIDFNKNDLKISNVENKLIENEQVSSFTPSFGISYFKSEFDNLPKPRSVSWDSFCKYFSTHQKRSKKSGAECWSPGVFKEGSTRKKEFVAHLSMAVLDVDNGTPLESIQDKIKELTYLIHSSFSHTEEQPKYRVIIPLSKEIDAANWGTTWIRINTWLGGVNDPSTKDASRIYHIPICPPGANNTFVLTNNGKYLDIDLLPVIEEFGGKKSQQNATIKPDQVKTNENITDVLGNESQLVAMQQRCEFIKHASAPDNQPSISEPLWLATLSNLCRFEGGEQAAHEASKHHPEYDEQLTQRKFERAFTGSPPITCSLIREHGFKGCPTGGCKLPSGMTTRSPAGLGVFANKTNNNSISDVNHALLPENLHKYLDKFYKAGLMFINGEFYGYRDGFWPKLDEQVDIRKTIAVHLGDKAEVKKINEMHTLCKDFCADTHRKMNPNLSLLCLQNGTLNLENGELIGFSPDHHLTYKSDISWDANAKCERWLRFLDEIFANDADKLEKIAFLKTWIGYCLVPDNRQHKFLWLVGAGGNGKSLLLLILTKLIGSVNISNAHIERLDDKYVRAELEGKLVNISYEMSAEATIADGYLKSIVSGDMVEAERKYQPSFSFKPFVRLIGATNHLPRLLDLTDGFFRRAIVLSFNRQFIGTDCDPDLENKLTNELPGILTWAVEGLKQLRLAGTIAIPPSSIAALDQYKAESDPAGIFAAECLAKVDTGGLPPSEIYTGYRDWCSKSGFSAMNKIKFGKRLVELGFTKRRSGGKDYWLVQPIEGNGFVWWSETVPVSNVVPINNPNAAKQFGL